MLQHPWYFSQAKVQNFLQILFEVKNSKGSVKKCYTIQNKNSLKGCNPHDSQDSNSDLNSQPWATADQMVMKLAQEIELIFFLLLTSKSLAAFKDCSAQHGHCKVAFL